MPIDALADGRPERYPYFENLNVIPFLNLLQFHADKAQEIRDQQEIERAEREAQSKFR